MSNGDMPATSIMEKDYDSDGKVFAVEYFAGLTKREHFAGLAMQGVMAKDNNMKLGEIAAVMDMELDDFREDKLILYKANAVIAVRQADALLEALEKDNG